jgi:ParB-like chromosome segregation protein Spo0J
VTAARRQPQAERPPTIAWPADRVERWPIAKLIPYARNARTHSEAQVAQIAASIREWGWTMPVLVDEGGTIIAGHGRVLAAHLLAIREVPVMVARGWTEAQRRAYTLTDNKLALNAGWEAELLGVELLELRDLGANLDLIGFTEVEIAGLLGAVDTVRLPDLPNGDRNPFQEMTFIVHDDQVVVIKEALRQAKARGPFEAQNENSNGNALARVCEAFCDDTAA